MVEDRRFDANPRPRAGPTVPAKSLVLVRGGFAESFDGAATHLLILHLDGPVAVTQGRRSEPPPSGPRRRPVPALRGAEPHD